MPTHNQRCRKRSCKRQHFACNVHAEMPCSSSKRFQKVEISKESKAITKNPFTLFVENLEKLKPHNDFEPICNTDDCLEVEFNVSETESSIWQVKKF